MSIFIWLSLFLQRIVFYLGDEPISISFILFFILLVFWIVSGKLKLLWYRFTLYLLVIGIMIFTALISLNSSPFFSLNSLLLLIVLYSPSVFVFKKDIHIKALTIFHKAMIFFSILGILQFFLQLVGVYIINFWSYIPKSIVINTFNFYIPIQYGSNLYKANGLFFLEPSFFSQFVALAIIIELNLLKKYWRLLIFIPALLFSFSGTGLLLLVIGSIPLIPRGKWKQILALLIIFGILGSFFFTSEYGIYITKRLAEFTSTGSSAYMRFISPFVNYWEFILREDTVSIFLGLGPGASNRYHWDTPVEPNFFIKILVEYGILGTLFLVYITHIFFYKKPFWLSFSIFLTMSILSGGSILVPQIIVIFYILHLFHCGIENNKKPAPELSMDT